MIVPSSRLLLGVTVIVLPFALLAAVIPTAAAGALLLIGVFLLVALGDAFAGAKILAGIGLTTPAVLRLSQGRNARLEVRVHNPRQQKKRLRLALAWPPALQPDDEFLPLALPAGSEWSRLELGCQPRQRGRHQLTAAFIESASPLGLWAVRQRIPLQTEIRVYPNLLVETKKLAALFLNRGAFGTHAARQIGQGRDFEKLREYVPGDSYNEIHWKATARRGKPISKVFQIERTQEVYVIVDASRLSARQAEPGTGTETTILERFVTAALVLGRAAEQQGDFFGLVTFADKVERFVRAKNGRGHYDACRDTLYTLQPKTVTPDFAELCTFIRLRLRRRALLVFLTALDDPALAESFVRHAELICRQHVLLVNMVRPPALRPLFTSPDVAEVDDLYQQLGGHLQWQKLRTLQKVLQRRAVRFSLLDNEQLSAELVAQYMEVKQRQTL